MKGQPIADAGFIAHEQGFEAVEPGVGVFDHGASAIEFGVKEGLVVGLPIGGATVAGDVGVDVTSGAGLPQRGGIEGTIRIQKQSAHGNAGRFEQDAQLLKQGGQPEAVVVVARLGRGIGQGLALVVGQKQGRRGTGLFTPLIAHGGPAIFGERVAAVELDAGTIQPVLVEA